ncbi:MAG: PEFG-CTERM domain-containing protein, partial [Nitrosopumilaceae archaeon]|nr:PEFG-CTERM domain-containing protein [Nitrosopumilaceae archaeon]
MYKVVLVALVALFFPMAAFAAPSVSLTTVDTNIKSLDTVLVTGKVTGVKDFKPATLEVIAPDGEIVYSYKIKPNQNDGSIKRLIHPPLPSFKEGTYTVTLSHPDTTETAQIEFTVTPAPLPRKDVPLSELEPVEEPEAEIPDFGRTLTMRADAMEGDTVIDIIGRT